MKKLTPAERLVVAADFPDLPNVYNLAARLCDTGVYFKLHIHLQSSGYRLGDYIHRHGLKLFADLKFYDTHHTLGGYGKELFSAINPEIVTVSASVTVRAMKALKNELPESEVLGVTLPTDFTESECERAHGGSIGSVVLRLAAQADLAGLDGVVSSGREVPLIRKKFPSPSFSMNVANIRPAGVTVVGEDQNPERMVTPTQAIKGGADRVIVGRAITQSDDPHEATMRIIEEIASVAP
jgi:orotidine-5'-phosphate decarboxylase